MKAITIRIVDSIDQEMERIQNQIRLRAYERFLRRPHDSNDELEDWLSAERELIRLLPATINREETRFVAQVEVPKIKPKDIEIQVTSQDLLINSTIIEDPGTEEGAVQSKSAFGVIRFPEAIDPAGVRAEYARGILRLTAPLANEGRTLKKSA